MRNNLPEGLTHDDVALLQYMKHIEDSFDFEGYMIPVRQIHEDMEELNGYTLEETKFRIALLIADNWVIIDGNDKSRLMLSEKAVQLLEANFS